jgi:glycosyltransferase involved in cell wall biosynthesis
MVNFTVAIPTYNGAQRLPKLLERLRSQIGIAGLIWEVIVVDNNSTDQTAEVVQAYQANWPHSSLRYAFEKQQGAAFARQQAMRLAQSNWVGFLDDDVLPDPDWVATAYAFSQAYPQAGAYGGQIHGSFEVPPPENFHRIQSFLAIRERGNQVRRYEPERLILPPSAAWVVNRKTWLEVVPQRPKLGGRAKGSMMQGDDYEPLLYMHRAGWEIWYNPAMQAYHQIPQRRLERDYLISLSHGCGLCVCHLRMIAPKSWQKPMIFLKITLGALKRLVQHWLQHRMQLKTDLVSACEQAFLMGSFTSSFYFLRSAFWALLH